MKAEANLSIQSKFVGQFSRLTRHFRKRINTVITRAKHGLIVIGDLDYLDDLTNWHKALNILRKDGRAHKVTGEQIRRWHTEMPLPAPTNVRRPRVKRGEYS